MIAISTLPDRATYRREGYWHQRQVFDAETLEALREVINAGCGMETGQPIRDAVFSGPWVPTEPDKGFVPVRDLTESGIWHMVTQGVLKTTAADLLDTSVDLDGAVGIVKPSGIGQTFPVHQDAAYYGPPDGRYVWAYVYLDDVTPENGSLQVAPRSHTHLRDHQDTGNGKKYLADPFEMVQPQAHAGDVLWGHLWLVHGSAQNQSGWARRAVRVGYYCDVRD